MAMFKWRSTGEPDKFKGDGIGDFFHIGCYAGNGRVIEAKGTKYGVVISSIDSWTHAGRVKGIQYDTSGAGSTTTQGGLTMEVFARVTTTSGKLNLRAQPDAAAVVLAKIPQDEVVKVLDQADGAWWKVSYGGTTGYAMAEFLTVGGGDGSGVRVVIPCAGREDAERLLELFKGAYVEE